MITNKTITVEDKNYNVNVCDLSSNWILVHDGIKAILCDENQNTSMGKLETINIIFEATTKEQCQAESLRLKLTGFDELFNNKSKRIGR